MRLGATARPQPPKHPLVSLGFYTGNPTTNAEIEALLPKIAPRKFDTVLQYRNRNAAAGESTGPQIVRSTDAAAMAIAGASTMTIGYYLGKENQGTLATGSLTNVATGVLDAFFKEEAERAAACGYGIICRLCPELNGRWQSGTFSGPYGFEHEEPAGFVEGWKHVVNIFREKGATNVKWCWNPSVWTPEKDGADTCDPTPWYPGDAYVDYIGLDGYAYGSKVAGTPEELFMPSYEASRVISKKPVLLCEVGIAEDVRYSKARWVNEMFRLVNEKMPAVRGITWWVTASGGETEWSIDSSGTDIASREAYKAGVNTHPLVN